MKKAASYQRWQAKKNAYEEAKEKTKYRDRAKERRKGLNIDYAETQGEMEQAEQIRKIDASKNKYLGGDVAHTHLVKGLDYQLLQQIRNDAEQAEDDNLEEKLQQLEKNKSIKAKSQAAASGQSKQGSVPLLLTHKVSMSISISRLYIYIYIYI